MQLNPYINFSGRCEEAITLYRSALGAELLLLMRNKDMPASAQQDAPAAAHQGGAPAAPLNPDKVLHASLRIGNSELMCTDGGGMPATGFHGISLSLSVADTAAADKVFAALGDGGKVMLPLQQTFWSPCFGMLTDRFGVAWLVGVEDPAQAG